MFIRTCNVPQTEGWSGDTDIDEVLAIASGDTGTYGDAP